MREQADSEARDMLAASQVQAARRRRPRGEHTRCLEDVAVEVLTALDERDGLPRPNSVLMRSQPRDHF